MPFFRWVKAFNGDLTPNVYAENIFGVDGHRKKDVYVTIPMTDEEYDNFRQKGFSWLIEQPKFSCDSPEHYKTGKKKPYVGIKQILNNPQVSKEDSYT